MSQKVTKKSRNSLKTLPSTDPVGLRIIGGTFRGRKLAYAGDRRVRPMKDRVREAVFNLVGMKAAGKFAIDLFGGTGAVGLEAVSRGAVKGLILEQHFPTAKVIQENIHTLELTETVELKTGNVFFWNQKRQPLPQDHPWLVFCCPPYDFFVQRWEDLAQLLASLYNESPDGSLFVIESDDRFDWSFAKTLFQKPDEDWDIRAYPPAVVGLIEK